MGTIATILRMVARRALGHWRLLLATTIGVLFSAALMAAVFIYVDSVRDLGLRYALRTAPPVSLDIQVLESNLPFAGDNYSKPKAATDRLVQQQVGDITTSTVHLGRSATFFPAAPGQAYPAAESRPRANLFFADDLSQHLRIVSGQAPAAYQAPVPGQPPSIQVLVGVQAAQQAHIHVGQSFDLYPFWRTAQPVRVTVAGLVQPVDPGAAYWFGQQSMLFSSTTTDWVTIPMLTTEPAVIQGVGAFLPDLQGDLFTYVFVDSGRINHANAASVEGRVSALSSAAQAQLPDATVQTQLANVIQQYQTHLFFARLPLLALMIQVVGIALFYLVIVSTMSVERQAGEMALLRSRGAGLREVMGIYILEGLAVALVATVAGPFIAGGAVSLLGLTPPFHALSGGHLVPTRLSWQAFGMAGLGAAAALVATLWPAYRAAHLSITGYKQEISRPQRRPFFLRYYLDLAFLLVGGFLLYQLRQHHALFTNDVFGGRSTDPLLIASPTLFMVIVALIILRIFPILLRAVLWIARQFGNATIAVGLTRMARSPMQHSRLILLLILATAVGMFAASFRATLERGYKDQAAYQAGSSGLVSNIVSPQGLPPKPFLATVASATGTRDLEPAVRTDAYYSPSQFDSIGTTVLGIPAASFGKIAYWRSDFASESLGSLLNKIEPAAAPQPKPPVIPADARFLGVWIRPAPASLNLNFAIELIDSDGASWDFPLTASGQSTSDGWQFYVANLSRPSFNHPATTASAAERQWTLGSLYIQAPPLPPLMPVPVTVLFADVQASSAPPTASGFSHPVTVESFQSPGRYSPIRGEAPGGDVGALTSVAVKAPLTGNAVRFAFNYARGNPPTTGVRFTRGPSVIPVLASQQFLSDANKHVGDIVTVHLSGSYPQLRIVGSFTYFPTYDPDTDNPLLVADLGTLIGQAAPGTNGIFPNEAWIGTPGSVPLTTASLAKRNLQAGTVLDREVVLAQESSDPLVAAGWEGILFLAFAAVLILSAIAFIAYCALGAQERSLEFAILRTMGFSVRQVLGVVGFEQSFVILVGLIAGTLLGFPLGRLMTGYLALDSQGRNPLPPLSSVVSWDALAVVYGSLLVLVVLAVASLVSFYSRLAIGRALRMGEL